MLNTNEEKNTFNSIFQNISVHAKYKFTEEDLYLVW